MDSAHPPETPLATGADARAAGAKQASCEPTVWKKKKKRKTSPKVVVVAIIEKNGAVLIGKRKWETQFAKSWEFPGGTLEEGESPEECLKRELEEELAVNAEVSELLCSTEHTYEPGWTIRLLAYRAHIASDAFTLSAHEEIRWVKPEDLTDYRFPDADTPIVELLMKLSRNDSHPDRVGVGKPGGSGQ